LGAVGARIRKPEAGGVVAAFRFPSITSEICRALSFGPVTRLFAKQSVALSADLETSQVDWVAGAAVMFRFNALEQVNFFDPTYFLYYEEVDLMRALRSADWEIWYCNEADVLHHEGASTNVRSGETGPKRRPKYLYESWRHYFLKNHGRTYALVTALGSLVAGGLNVVISGLRGRRSDLPIAFFADQWRHVVVPLMSGRT